MTKIEELPHQLLNEEFTEYDLSYKIIVVGDPSVGKSCLTMRGTKNHYEECYFSTVGFEFYNFNIRVKDKNIKLQIWDTCGQENYRALTTSFHRNSSLAIIVYSIDNFNSFNNIEIWLNEIKTQSNPEIKTFLIGNKADLEDERQISIEKAKKFSEDHSFDYFVETSAKTGFNAQEVFIRAAKELYLFQLQYKDRAPLNGSIAPIRTPYRNGMNTNNNYALEDEGDTVRKKKKCC